MLLYRKNLNKLAIILVFGVSLICFVYMANFTNSFSENINKFKTLTLGYLNDNKTKYILYWSPFGNTWNHSIGYGFEPFRKCEYKNCYATTNKSLIDLEEFDALLFHALYDKKEHGIPWIRLPHQVYIFENVDAPVYVCPNLEEYASYFNWTMTYRFDSDIRRRHGFVFKEETDYIMPAKVLLENKTDVAAWMASNCRTGSRREELINEIQNYMAVDVYGSCGKLKCPRTEGNLSAPECYDMIEKKYKFYFSFENSYCRDYSTEKLYNVLQKNVVPVVYGFDDYKLSAPPKSVINVADFKSVLELTDYLKYLDENDSEYLKYFEWKKHYRVISSPLIAACELCQKLHQPIKQSIYYDVHEWWWGKNKSFCKSGKELPKIVRDVL